MALAAEAGTVCFPVRGKHGYGTEQIRHITGHDQRGDYFAGQFLTEAIISSSVLVPESKMVLVIRV